MAEETLRQHLDEAFHAPAGFPDDRLLSRAMAAVAAETTPSRNPLASRRWAPPRVAMQLVAAALTLVLIGGAAAAFFALHRPPATTRPVTGPVIFPTKMISATTGWAETQHASDEHIWRTTDGGTSWTDVTPQMGAFESGGWQTYYLDATHAWVVLAGSGQDAATLVVVKTADGGRTWQRGATLSVSGSNAQPGSLDVLDADHGWFLLPTGSPFHSPAWPALYATSDGGLHWTLASAHAGAGTETAGLLPGDGKVEFTSAATGWMTMGLYQAQPDGSTTLQHYVLLGTRDGGRSWHNAPLPAELGPSSVIDLPSFFGRRGFTAVHEVGAQPTHNAVFLTTSDGGVTWTAHQTDWQTVGEIQFVDADHGFAIAGPSSVFLKQRPEAIALPLFRTADGGASWTAVKSNLDFLAADGSRLNYIQFVDQNAGFASIWGNGGPKRLYATHDGGKSWSQIAVCKADVGLTYPPDVC